MWMVHSNQVLVYILDAVPFFTGVFHFFLVDFKHGAQAFS
jgi:hypothetical protein